MVQEYDKPTYWMQTYVAHAPLLPNGETPDLWIGAMGRFRSKGRFVFEQVPSQIAVHVIEAGAGIMVADGIEYEVSTGDTFTFFPGVHYRYWDLLNAPWYYSWFWLKGAKAEAALALTGVTPQTPHKVGQFAKVLEPLLGEIAQQLIGHSTPPLFAQAAAWRLLDTMERQGDTDPIERNVAEIAHSLLDGHFTNAMSIDELARQLGISRSTLFRKFHDAYGISPKEYQEAVRMERAKRLLRHSPRSIKDVAAACGYDDSHYFSRAYRRAHGHSPGVDRTSD